MKTENRKTEKPCKKYEENKVNFVDNEEIKKTDNAVSDDVVEEAVRMINPDENSMDSRG